ncbi:alpha/beta hydrolase [Streptococcus panodentis]|uniref:Alpha/beta hydrolase n=1 Tax=Streptococcus panodentis TaxID=1581472 RepID=A0ABS5ATL9_9STRE|nr:alpha/beta hydrolase [Streptococcus panodentis]MBP2619919.1 alpha/beta hydrolase [Streptococcus panodentis]
MKKKLGFKLLVLLILAIVGLTAFYTHRESAELDTKNYVQSTTPTLFFHGYGSSANAAKHMTEAARKAGVTQTIIVANVSRTGQVSLQGEIPKGAVNPIVRVNYEDNRNPDYAQDGQYAAAVVRKLQETYGFKQMNFVGHSMGNMSIFFYMLENSQDEQLPQLQKQVNIANHVNGLEGMDLPENLTIADEETGQPSAMSQTYQTLLGLREIYPQDQVDVLNIYGDFKKESDGSVLNVSSRSLKYLLADNAKSYQEKKMTGQLAQHSKLRENPEVEELLIDFLWGK